MTVWFIHILSPTSGPGLLAQRDGSNLGEWAFIIFAIVVSLIGSLVNVYKKRKAGKGDAEEVEIERQFRDEFDGWGQVPGDLTQRVTEDVQVGDRQVEAPDELQLPVLVGLEGENERSAQVGGEQARVGSVLSGQFCLN